MSGWCPAPASPISATWSPASTRTPARSRLRNGEIPIFEPGLDALVAENAQQARLFFDDRCGGGGARPRTLCSSPSARRRGAATAMPTCPMSTRRPRDRAPRSTAIPSSSPIDGAGRHRRRGRAHHPRGPPGRRFRRGIQSRVPARRRRHRGLQASRPDRDRHRGPRAGR